MNSSNSIEPVRFDWVIRLPMVLFGFGLLTLFAIAWTLEPNPRGWGTHQQLGFPPCSLEVLLDIRCPACGMTTAWAHLIRGQLVDSFHANCGGALLAIVSMVVAPWMLISGLVGRWIVRPPNEWVVVAVAVAILLVTLVDWAVRLAS